MAIVSSSSTAIFNAIQAQLFERGISVMGNYLEAAPLKFSSAIQINSIASRTRNAPITELEVKEGSQEVQVNKIENLNCLIFYCESFDILAMSQINKALSEFANQVVFVVYVDKNSKDSLEKYLHSFRRRHIKLLPFDTAAKYFTSIQQEMITHYHSAMQRFQNDNSEEEATNELTRTIVDEKEPNELLLEPAVRG